MGLTDDTVHGYALGKALHPVLESRTRVHAERPGEPQRQLAVTPGAKPTGVSLQFTEAEEERSPPLYTHLALRGLQAGHFIINHVFEHHLTETLQKQVRMAASSSLEPDGERHSHLLTEIPSD